MFANDLEGPWWQAGTLDRQVHYRLIQQRHGVARRSGLGEAFMSRIWDKLPADVLDVEREWLAGVVRREAIPSLLYVGNSVRATERFRVYVGALLRNFIDARISSLDDIADEVLSGDAYTATALFVPDFCLDGETTLKSDAVKRTITSIIRRRIIDGQITCLFASSLESVSKVYGPALAAEIGQQFERSKLA